MESLFDQLPSYIAFVFLTFNFKPEMHSDFIFVIKRVLYEDNISVEYVSLLAKMAYFKFISK